MHFVIHTLRIVIISSVDKNYALNKIHSEASLKLLHISAQGCHHQGVIPNKDVKGQQPYIVIVLPLLK
jgi:hypothetical protein